MVSPKLIQQSNQKTKPQRSPRPSSLAESLQKRRNLGERLQVNTGVHSGTFQYSGSTSPFFPLCSPNILPSPTGRLQSLLPSPSSRYIPSPRFNFAQLLDSHKSNVLDGMPSNWKKQDDDDLMFDDFMFNPEGLMPNNAGLGPLTPLSSIEPEMEPITPKSNNVGLKKVKTEKDVAGTDESGVDQQLYSLNLNVYNNYNIVQSIQMANPAAPVAPSTPNAISNETLLANSGQPSPTKPHSYLDALTAMEGQQPKTINSPVAAQEKKRRRLDDSDSTTVSTKQAFFAAKDDQQANNTTTPNIMELPEPANVNSTVTLHKSPVETKKTSPPAALPTRRSSQRRTQQSSTRGSTASGESDRAKQSIQFLALVKKSAKGSDDLYMCPHKGCERKFSWKWSMEEHARTHMQDSERVHVCTYCNKGFFTSGCLKSHTRIHTRKPFSYVCKVAGCTKKYSTSEGLRLHTRNHHDLDKKWKCPSEGCSKCFVRQSDMRLHIIRIHSTDRPYPCNTCKKSFACYSELKRHAICHTKKKKPKTKKPAKKRASKKTSTA